MSQMSRHTGNMELLEMLSLLPYVCAMCALKLRAAFVLSVKLLF